MTEMKSAPVVEVTLTAGPTVNVGITGAGPAGPQGQRGEPGERGEPGYGIPAGGAVGDVLVKQSTEDYDVGWGVREPDLDAVYAAVRGRILLDAHPVGSYYWSDVETEPGALFGGVWERVKDRFLLAAGDVYEAGDTGGEAAVTLEIAEVPGHEHGAGTLITASGGNHSHQVYRFPDSGTTGTQRHTGPFSSASSNVEGVASGAAGEHSHTINGSTAAAGGGEPHNNMPPYTAAYCWRRTA